jgi:hypothetical protein
MDLKVSLKTENGLFNFLKKKIKKKKKKFLGYRHMAPWLQPKVFHCSKEDFNIII